jgi:8-oxo-dGTP pyrophosphatase MutT (NUDIX family)
MKKEKSAGVIIYYLSDSKPKFLLVKSNYWGFVKGIIEKNESIKETAKREASEEVNLSLSLIPKFREFQNWMYKRQGELISKQAVFFLSKISEKQTKQVKISEEHTEFGFFTLQESLEKMNIKSNQDLIKKANKFILEFEKQKTLF